MNPRDRLQYALYLQRLQELFVIKENIAFEYQHANYNQAAAQIDKAVDKMLQDNVVNIVDGTTSLEKPNMDHVITEALSKQQNMLIKTPDRYIQNAVEQNTKHYTDILQSRIEKENYSLQRKIEEEYRKKKYNNLSEAEAKKLITEKFQDHGRRRAKNIVKDALHTNQSHMSWVSNRENYKYKVWMNGQSKSGVRYWHIKSKIQPVEIDDFFDIFGPTGHAQMMYPGDLNGGAENVANCKCWLYYTNIAPSNLKKRGTIQVNPNVNLTNENKEIFSANTEKKGLFTKISNKLSNVKNRILSRIPRVKSEQKSKRSTQRSGGLNKLNSNPQINSSNDKTPTKISKNQFKRKMKIIADKKDVNKLTNLFSKLDKLIEDPSLEYGLARTKSGKIIELTRDKDNHLKIPEDVQEEGRKKGLHTLIHNHPKGTSPLSSPEDVGSFAEYGSEYGISKNELGIFRVKNNNISGNRKNATQIESAIADVKTEMKKDFHNHLKDQGIDWREYKKQNKTKYKQECLEFTNENIEKYVPWYQEALNPFNMEVIFIK